MAASKLILSHARRHYTPIASQPSHLSSLLVRSSSNSQNLTSFLGFRRFSTDSPPESEPKPLTSSPPPPPKPVSYAPKPKPPSEEPQQQEQPRPLRRNRDEFPSSTEEGGQGGGRVWTREDIRYVKDVPSISPVSYPSRVANLPEDRAAAETTVDGEGKEETRKDDSELERERRKIDNDRRLRRAFRVEEEKVLPFPTLIKVEKKKSKVVLDLQEAIREVKANAKSSFVETIEAHVGLGVDPRRGDQMVRGAATLPHGTGKVVRVAVFAEGDAAEEARAAGADIVGAEELIEEIRKGGGKLNFDKCIATPIFMPRLGKIARILGPRGLMPNPKLGSVTSDVAGAVREAKRGRIDFKIDKTAIVHVGLGKVNFSDDSLRENVGAFVNALLRAKPIGLKKTSKYAGYVNSFSLSSTMGPGFPVSIQSLSMAAEHYARLKLQ